MINHYADVHCFNLHCNVFQIQKHIPIFPLVLIHTYMIWRLTGSLTYNGWLYFIWYISHFWDILNSFEGMFTLVLFHKYAHLHFMVPYYKWCDKSQTLLPLPKCPNVTCNYFQLIPWTVKSWHPGYFVYKSYKIMLSQAIEWKEVSFSVKNYT